MSENSKMPWKEIIATSVITILITIASSMALDYIRTREAKLTYTLSNKIPFTLEDQEMGIYITTLTNEGKSPAKGITWYIEISEAIIEQCEISTDPAIEILKTVNNNSLTLDIPLLNPSESIDISLLAMGFARSLPVTPIISVRGEGIIGVETISTKNDDLFSFENIVNILTAIIAIIILLAIVRARAQESLISGEKTQSGVFAYLFGIQGSLEYMEYYHQKSEVKYWKESDRLGNLAMTLTEDEIKKILFTLSNLLKIASIPNTSKSIIYYNIAKIYAHLKDYKQVKDNIIEAKKYHKTQIEKRLGIDPIWSNVPEKYIGT